MENMQKIPNRTGILRCESEKVDIVSAILRGGSEKVDIASSNAIFSCNSTCTVKGIVQVCNIMVR